MRLVQESAQPAIPLAERLTGLRAVRDFLADEPPELIALLTEIATHRAVRYEIAAAVRTLDGALDEVTRNRPSLRGSLAAFMPSNILLYSYVLYQLVPSLFVERLRFRPASSVSDQTIRLHRMLEPLHGIPVTSDTSSQRVFLDSVIGADDVVVFTGTYQNAEKIRPQLAPDQLFLFLGSGINPFVVAPGADVADAVRDAVDIRLLNAGQDCLAPDIFFVHKDLLDEFLDGIIVELGQLRYGPYDDPDAGYGPIFYEGALESAALHLYRHRGDIVHGGAIDFRARRIEPAVLLSEFSARPSFIEFFTPIFNLVGYEDAAAMGRLLADGSFAERALGASVYGNAPELVTILSRRHTVTVGSTLLSIDDGNRPFGGGGPMANYASWGGSLSPRPILISAEVAACWSAEG